MDELQSAIDAVKHDLFKLAVVHAAVRTGARTTTAAAAEATLAAAEHASAAAEALRAARAVRGGGGGVPLDRVLGLLAKCLERVSTVADDAARVDAQHHVSPAAAGPLAGTLQATLAALMRAREQAALLQMTAAGATSTVAGQVRGRARRGAGAWRGGVSRVWWRAPPPARPHPRV